MAIPFLEQASGTMQGRAGIERYQTVWHRTSLRDEIFVMAFPRESGLPLTGIGSGHTS